MNSIFRKLPALFKIPLIIFSAAFSFTSCDYLLYNHIPDNSPKVDAVKTVNLTYDSSSPFFELDNQTKTVNISGLPTGAEVFLVRTNPTNAAIDGWYVQSVKSAGGMNLNTSQNNRSAAAPDMENMDDINDDGLITTDEKWPCFLPPTILPPVKSGRSALGPDASFTAEVPGESCTPANYQIGDEKYIYIDCNTQVSEFALAKAYLKAKGTYCNVWIVDGYQEDSDDYYYCYYNYSNGKYTPKSIQDYYIHSNAHVKDEFVTKIKDSFDAMYPLVTELFGKPSNKIYDLDNDAFVNMNCYDDTWNSAVSATDDTIDPVNIVIYDIGDDSKSNGILGYFYSKDYYTNYLHTSRSVKDDTPYSNEGKYFYIDSAFAGSNPDEVILTLAHEFQHMIDFGVKTVEQNLESSTAHNEMKSMMCEDLMAEILNITKANTPVNRLPHFCGSYLYNGPQEYDYEVTILSYATAYAFGAFLLRNYGGADLMKAIASNDSVDMASVLSAVNTVNGTSYTMEKLLADYTKACIYSSTPEGVTSSLCPAGFPSFKNSSSITSQANSSCNFIASPVNIFNLNEEMETNSPNGSYAPQSIWDMFVRYYMQYEGGPMLYTSDSHYHLRPYGMMLNYVGDTKSSNITLNFSQNQASNNQKCYIYIKQN